jgi:hypothetical protein
MASKQPTNKFNSTSAKVTSNPLTSGFVNNSVIIKPSGPDIQVRITEAYARLVAADTFFWAWPMINIFNRRLAFSEVKEIVRAGPLPQAPINHLAMFTDYVDPAERAVACPNQDVVYGVGSLALDLSPVVIQVPDFGDRFWLYQVVDTRTDSFAKLGKMHGTQPGFYLLAGPGWKGTVPRGISGVFHSTTNSGMVAPRVFMDDTPEDREAIQPLLTSIMMYPMAQFDGKMKTTDWANIPKIEVPDAGNAEMSWVDPEKFFDQIDDVLDDAPALPGEEARYAQALAVWRVATRDPKIKAAMIQGARDTQGNVIKPLFDFRNFGRQLPNNWSTINNGAAFGTDYFTRTAVAKSNILVNIPEQAKYFYQDLDFDGARLNSANRYAVTFTKEQIPPVSGFWSLTLYNEHHFFEINDLNRYSVGTKSRSMKLGADGSLTIYVQAEKPSDDLIENWLPAPKSGDFSLYLRTYWPKEEVIDSRWTPPGVMKIK